MGSLFTIWNSGAPQPSQNSVSGGKIFWQVGQYGRRSAVSGGGSDGAFGAGLLNGWTASGTRPSFTPAAPPELGERLFGEFVRLARARHARVETGVFGAHMRVQLINDGPVTFWLQTRRPAG